MRRFNGSTRSDARAAKWAQDLAELRKNFRKGHKNDHTLIRSSAA